MKRPHAYATSFGQIPAVCGDKTLIRQVYGDLLGNAVKFTKGRNPRKDKP
jgi:signal transduction histidine kinase